MFFRVSFGNSLRSPIAESLTLLSSKFLISFLMVESKSFIIAETSLLGRDQFSLEKVYSVRWETPISPQTRTISLTEFIPSLCPAALGRFLSFAHLPFPSIIIAICLGKFPLAEILSLVISFTII